MSALHGLHLNPRGWSARRMVACALATVVFSLFPASRVDAQTVRDDNAQHAPRFFLAMNGGRPAPMDVSRVPVLRARLSLDLEGVTVKQAIAAISRQSGLVIWYSDDVLRRNAPVHLRAEAITVAAALTDVLMDAGVDVVFSRDGTASLVKRIATAAPVQVGAVTGRVTDSISREGVGGVAITVEGTRLSATTAADGGYTIRGVPAGNRSIIAQRLGFVRQSHAVTVADNESTTVDFVLVRAPTTLSEVVTTVTGEQRRVELGHVVGRINADSVVKEAPVSTVSELLTGRVAGVQVFQGQGTVGGSVRLQVRGRNSLLLESNPIVIVDGVRYSSSQIPISSGLGGAADVARSERTSPLNDLNPNDIASIEVVKGPSAATLYGTDAANGVILITTKRGRGGPPRWNAYARMARTSLPTFRYPDAHLGFGTSESGSVVTYCNLRPPPWAVCRTRQDSVVVVPNPLNDPDLTIFGSQPMWETGISVAGGSGDVGYYFSGSYQDAAGPVQMPRAAVEQLEAARGAPIPDEWRNPNTRSNLNLRANVTAQLGTADLAVQAGYVRDETQSFPEWNPFSFNLGLVAGTPTSPYGQAPPEEIFAMQSTERTDRFVGSATAQWRPLSWLRTRAAVGLDIGARHRSGLLRRGDALIFQDGFLETGAATDERARQVTTTGDLGASATARRGRLSFRTSVGAQYVRNLLDLVGSGGRNLPPGGSSVQEAASGIRIDQTYSETVTLGVYLEEMVALNDRLFLTGALRFDGASTFGQEYDAAAYPKASLSWLVSEEPFFPGIPGLNELRLRYAVGASGLQPKPEWARPTFAVTQSFERGWVNDQPQTVLKLAALGNPDLRPERVREHEFGFDAAGLAGRAQLGLTWFQRRTVDQIVVVPVAPGYGSILTNLGLTKQWGFEAELGAHLVDTRAFSWDVTATHSVRRTKLLDDGGTDLSSFGFVEGFSLTARFQPEVTFEDLDGDGIIGRSEVQWSSRDERLYAGETEPPISQALTSVLGFLDRRVRFSALLERRAGFVQQNDLKRSLCVAGACSALADPNTPLVEQAEALAAEDLGSGFALLESGDYIRLRELTLALDLPPALVHRFGGRSAGVKLSARNVALWTDFSGPDIESFPVSQGGGGLGGIPQGRTWAIRFDVGF